MAKFCSIIYKLCKFFFLMSFYFQQSIISKNQSTRVKIGICSTSQKVCFESRLKEPLTPQHLSFLMTFWNKSKIICLFMVGGTQTHLANNHGYDNLVFYFSKSIDSTCCRIFNENWNFECFEVGLKFDLSSPPYFPLNTTLPFLSFQFLYKMLSFVTIDRLVSEH